MTIWARCRNSHKRNAISRMGTLCAYHFAGSQVKWEVIECEVLDRRSSTCMWSLEDFELKVVRVSLWCERWKVNDEDGIERSLKVLVDGKTCVRLIGTDLPSLEGWRSWKKVACFFCNVILLAEDNAETSPFILKDWDKDLELWCERRAWRLHTYE
jgi:hypothetical protein